MLLGKNYDPLQMMYGDLSDQSVAVATTNGTTPVTVPFALNINGVGSTPTNAPSGTLVAIILIANDATAGNITVTNAGATVATIAKGVTQGAVIGAVALTNTAMLNGNAIQVVSSTAGNATVMVHYYS